MVGVASDALDLLRGNRIEELETDEVGTRFGFNYGRCSGSVGKSSKFLEGIAVTQDQVYIRVLAVDFFVSLLKTVETWAERTLAEIESWDDLSSDGKYERALEKIRELPIPTPESVQKTPVPPRTQLRPRRHDGRV